MISEEYKFHSAPLQAEEDAADVAEEKAGKDYQIYLVDLKDLLDTPQGRRVFRAVLDRLGYFGAVWRRGADIHYSAARHDAAREIFIDLTLAAPETCLRMFMEGNQTVEEAK